MIRATCISKWLTRSIGLKAFMFSLYPGLLHSSGKGFIPVNAAADLQVLFVSPLSDVKFHTIERKKCHAFLSVLSKQKYSKSSRDVIISMPQLHMGHRRDDSNADTSQLLLDGHHDSLYDDDDAGTNSNCASLYESLYCAVTKAMELNRRQHQSLTVEYQKAQQAEQLIHRADLLTANLYQFKATGVLSIRVQDWEGEEVTLAINTTTYSSAQEEAQDLYQKARKMKRGSKVVQQLLHSSIQKQPHYEQLLYELKVFGMSLQREQAKETSEDEDDLMSQMEQIKEKIRNLSKKHDLKITLTQTSNQQLPRDRMQAASSSNGSNKQQQQQHACRKFRSPSGLVVLVGRNQRDNEYISFHVARGKDIWFHARGCPGAHVLLQVRRGDSFPPSEEDMQFAANLAAFYSNARTERKAVITSAEPKHIQKPRGAPPGAVKLRQELGSVIGYPMDVAEELRREADNGGGAWGSIGDNFEMGALSDKAKNRKRTLQVEREKQAKRRAQRREKQQPRARRMQNDETDDNDAACDNDK